MHYFEIQQMEGFITQVPKQKANVQAYFQMPTFRWYEVKILSMGWLRSDNINMCLGDSDDTQGASAMVTTLPRLNTVWSLVMGDAESMCLGSE